MSTGPPDRLAEVMAQRDAAVRALLSGDYTQAQVADILGLSLSSIRQISAAGTRSRR